MRLGLVSDAHGNAEAFTLAIRTLAEAGADEVWFLGDAVGYLPGVACIDLIMDSGLRALRGNHEHMLLTGIAEPAKEAVYRHRATLAQMKPAHWRAINSWQITRRIEVDGTVITACHGSPIDPIGGYVYPDTTLEQFAGATSHCDVFITANTHHPFVRNQDGSIFANTGSCGLPRDDGRFGSVLLCDLETLQVEVLRFDIQEATMWALSRVGSVHSSVHSLIARRSDHVVGRVV